MRTAAIVGTGMYAPKTVVTNSFFNQLYGRNVASFLEKERNIFERHYMDKDETTSDMIVAAASSAMAQAGIAALDLDLIIVATDTPDYVSPSTASVVQFKLGAKNAAGFDLNAACAGFVTALDVGSKFIKSDKGYKNILVAGGYGMSKFINWDDYKIASLFADGAGAVILRANDHGDGVLAATLKCDGQYHDYMGIYGGGTFMPITHEVIERKDHLLNFAKKIPTETNAVLWPKIVHELLDRIGKSIADVKHLFLTQINIGSINAALANLGLGPEMSHNIMDRYGYTGSACIPMIIADAQRQNKLAKGDLLVLVGSGGGMSAAGVALTWSLN